jgi:hypothetical protein
MYSFLKREFVLGKYVIFYEPLTLFKALVKKLVLYIYPQM